MASRLSLLARPVSVEAEANAIEGEFPVALPPVASQSSLLAQYYSVDRENAAIEGGLPVASPGFVPFSQRREAHYPSMRPHCVDISG